MKALSRALVLGALCAGLLAGPAGPALAAEPASAPELSLDQVIAVALERNPGLVSAQEDVAVAEAQVTQSASAYWPQISAQGGYHRQWYENPRTALSQGGVQGQYNTYSTGLNATQYLYDFGQTAGKVEKSRQNLSASRSGVTKSRNDLVREVKRSYYEVNRQAELVTVYETALKVQQEHLRQAQAYHRVGVKAKLDVTNSELAVANTQLQLIQARYGQDAARLSLENLLGGPPAPGPYRLAKVPEAAEAPVQDEALVQEAMARRPEVAALRAQLLGADAQLESAQGGYWPSLTANANWGYDSTDFPLQEGWLAGASLNWPLFNGSRTQGAVSEAKAGIRKLQAQLRQAELGIRQEVSLALLSVRQAAEATNTARVALRQAGENLNLADNRWKVGAGSQIEYSDAQNQFIQAQGNLVQAIYLKLQALADLERALGAPRG